jgi:predicted nucleic acid-binding Zn ribbon protein
VRKKNYRPEDIKNILGSVIKKLDTEIHGQKEEIVQAWQRAIIPKALSHTRPVALKRNVLTIEVDSSTWLYVLSLDKKNILEAMKKAMGKGKIEDIRFRIGEIS